MTADVFSSRGADGRPVIVQALRTPISTAGMSLTRSVAADLAATVIGAVAASLDPHAPAVVDVVLGNCMGPGGDVARVAALQAGLPVGVPGLTIDRQCGSGLAAIAVAASMVQSEAGIILAGGSGVRLDGAVAVLATCVGSRTDAVHAPALRAGGVRRSGHGSRRQCPCRRVRHHTLLPTSTPPGRTRAR